MNGYLILFLTIALTLSCAKGEQANRDSLPANSATISSPSPSIANSEQVASPPVSVVSNPDIVLEIQKIVARTLDLDRGEVGVNTPFSELRKPADALDFIEIIMSVEEAFDIQIKDTELGGSDINAVTRTTVQEIADLVASRKRQNK